MFPTVLAVPAVILAARDVEAFKTVALVLAFTTEAIEDDAVVRLARVARDPEESVASVRLRVANDHTCDAVRFELPVDRVRPILPGVVRVDVATFHTSAASVPKVVRERVAEDQTLRGMVEAREVEAVRTIASVWVLMVDIALVMLLLTPAIEAPRDDEAAKTLLLTVVTFPLTVARVEPKLLDAAKTLPFVVLILVLAVASVAPRLVEALVTSDCTARDPAVSPAPVRVLVA
jgi:hypothetical protein